MTSPIESHKFSPSEFPTAEGPVCSVCGHNRAACEMRYKPREYECLCHGYPGGVYFGCPVHGSGTRRPNAEVCDNFTGLRQWGIGPAEPWRTCQSCGWPKAQHQLPSCTGVLNIAGKDYRCELTMPHQGWGHSNREAQAIWGDRGPAVIQDVTVHSGPGSDPRDVT